MFTVEDFLEQVGLTIGGTSSDGTDRVKQGMVVSKRVRRYINTQMDEMSPVTLDLLCP